MGYIQDEKHFINYLNFIAREHGITDVFPAQFYIRFIYNQNIYNRYTWDVRNDPWYLTRDGVIEWLRENMITREPIAYRDIEHVFTREFIDLIDDLNGVPGVYMFHTKDGTPLYVGKSKNLGGRIQHSIRRFVSMDKDIYVSVICTETEADAIVLEAYYIAKLKPMMNGTGNTPDPLTIDVTNPPEFSEPVRATVCKERSDDDGSE